MRAHTRHVFGLVLALLAALALSACYRPAGEDLEPTAVGQIVSQATSTAVPVVTEEAPSPEEPVATAEAVEATEEIEAAAAPGEAAGTPTAEVMTPLPSPLPATTEAGALDGQGGQVSGPTQTQVVALAPTTVPPTETPPPLPSATPTPTPTPTLDPALGIPEGASPIPFDQPYPTFTPSEVGGGSEAVPLGERPAEQAAPVDGQGGQADVAQETPVAIAQQPTLTTNQMTATSVVYQATARAAATLGTQLPPLGAPQEQIPAGQGGEAGQQEVAPQQVVPTATPTVPPAPANCGQHLISPGETLSRIAQRYGVTTTQMAQANNIVNADLIKAGDTLIVPCAQAAPAAPAAQPSTTTTTTGGPTVYVVQGGDNIYRISLRFGITMSELIAANGMTPATMNTISVGQELIIPRTAVTAPTAAPVVPTATPLPTLAPQPTQPVANVG